MFRPIKTNLLLLLLLLLLLVLPISSEAQERINCIDFSKGLPNSEIRCIAQDDMGCMWFGGLAGLYRYDGYFFNEYYVSNSLPLKSNHIKQLDYWKEGLMVVLTNSGNLCFFDTHANKFVETEVINEDIKQQCQLTYTYSRILKDRKLLLWNNDSDAELWDFQNGHFVAEKAENNIYVNNGKVKLAAEKMFRRMGAPEGDVFFDNQGNPILADNNISIYLKNKSKLAKIDVFNPKLVKMDLSRKYRVVTQTNKGLVWISSYGGGVTQYNLKTGQAKKIKGLKTQYIVDMQEDMSGNIWVAEEFYGVSCISSETEKPQAQLMLHDKRREAHLNQIKVLRKLDSCQDNNSKQKDLPNSKYYGKIFVSTDNQMFVFDSNLTNKQLYLDDIDTRDICLDARGRIWVTTRRHGLLIDKNKVRNVPAKRLNKMLLDRDQRMWITTQNNGVLMSKNGETFHHFLGDLTLRIVYQDNSGMIWVGGEKGLFRFKPQELIADSMKYEEILTPDDEPFREVVCLYEDDKSRKWVGTRGDGVYYTESKSLNSQKGDFDFIHLTTANGLINNSVQSIISSPDNSSILLATKRGITSYCPEDRTSKYIYIDVGDPQITNFYTENNVCSTDKPQTFLYGTQYGLLYFDHKPIFEDRVFGKLKITDVLVGGTSVMDEWNEIALDYDQNTFTVHFSTFNFLNPERTKYSYWLEGYDKEWSEVTNNSFVSYKKLPSGSYRLHVKAIEDNNWKEQEITVNLTVAPPWYATWWAILLYILFGSVIVGVVARQLWTIYRLRQNISMEKKLTQYKLVFFTNISHEFRTPLTIIRGAIDTILSKGGVPADLRQPIANIQSGTSRMTRLIDQLLEFRKMQNNKLKLSLQNIDIVSFARHLGETMKDVADGKKINYVFSTTEKSHLVYVDKDYIDKIIYNLLSNAFKYTPVGGNVTLKLSFIRKSVVIQVVDTGIGVPEEKRSQLFSRYLQSQYVTDSIGIGLNLTAELVKTHKGVIEYSPNPEGGSIFSVTLPDDESVYKPEDFLQQSAIGSQLPVLDGQSYDNYRELTPLPLNNRKVLLVEDDPELRRYIKSLLEKYVYVDDVSDGAEALNKLRANANANANAIYDLIISDVMMPGMNGWQLIQKIRNDECLKTLPVILLTSLTDDEKVLKGVKLGADAYITKPFKSELLVMTMSRLIEQREMLKSAYQKSNLLPNGPEQSNSRSNEADLMTVVEKQVQVIIDEKKKRLFNEMNLWLDSHISSSDISVDDWADAMGIKRSSFYREVKKLAGMSPNELIRQHRMEKAVDMLKNTDATVSEVAFATGFSSPFYFSKCFKDKYGVSPSVLRK